MLGIDVQDRKLQNAFVLLALCVLGIDVVIQIVSCRWEEAVLLVTGNQIIVQLLVKKCNLEGEIGDGFGVPAKPTAALCH